jgi:hypothetical protein
MFLVIMATVFSAIALLSGVLAIGSGDHWHFSKMDIWRGRRNAVLYIWVTFSTIFSMAHCASLVEYGTRYHWLYRDYDTGRWMCIHGAIALMLISAHIYILRTLSAVGTGEQFLWGSRRVR